jgi:toxin ParE1/3/4
VAELKWTREALNGLEEIPRYITQDNPRAADRVIDGILNKADLLADFPDIGTRWRLVTEGEVRMVLYGHYRIAYRRRTDTDAVEILGIFHGALDLDRYFP